MRSNACVAVSLYEALQSFKRTTLDIRIFLRFRRVLDAMKSENMNHFLKLPDEDERFILEHDIFNTHELMVASDLVITANASFAINEALVAEIPVFTFDYTLKTSRYFNDYCPQFVLTDSGAILYCIRGIKYYTYDAIEYQELRQDADYFHDGKNKERLQELVYETLREME